MVADHNSLSENERLELNVRFNPNRFNPGARLNLRFNPEFDKEQLPNPLQRKHRCVGLRPKTKANINRMAANYRVDTLQCTSQQCNQFFNSINYNFKNI